MCSRASCCSVMMSLGSRWSKGGRAWRFAGDGASVRLVSEAQRLRLARPFDPLLAVRSSNVDPLPHQITAVYPSITQAQPPMGRRVLDRACDCLLARTAQAALRITFAGGCACGAPSERGVWFGSRSLTRGPNSRARRRRGTAARPRRRTGTGGRTGSITRRCGGPSRRSGRPPAGRVRRRSVARAGSSPSPASWRPACPGAP